MTHEKMRKRTPASKKALRSVLTAAALGAGFLALTTPSVQADSAVYQQHTINAGVLVVSSDPAPYVFYVLNNRPDVRPPEMNLVNPLAPALTQPNQAAYWEVKLNDVSDAELSRYDVLYLLASGTLTFSPVVNEKLRRFVDGGGQLIVEYGTAAAPAQGLFTGTGAATGSGGATFPVTGTTQVHQSVISQPYLLTQADLNGLTGLTTIINKNTSDVQHASEFDSLFSPALVNGSGQIMSTAQIGAGQVVVSSLNIGAVGTTTNLGVASTVALKLLTNILSYSEAHPNENKTSHGNASNAGLASFSPAWQYPVSSSSNAQSPSGAAVWGNFVYVTDAAGTLHAFDAYPSESLLGGAADDGIIDYSLGKSYDEIWNATVGTNASAPTVASLNGTNYVFVERVDGSVVYFNAVTGVSTGTLTPPTPPTPYIAASYAAPQNTPSPTFYDGRIYAGQANGSLFVYDLNESVSYFVPLNPMPPTTAEPVTGPPAVGLLQSGDTSVLTAVVPTQYNMYTVLLGGRNEPLKSYSPGGTLNGYSINRSGRYDISNLFADINSTVPPLQAYDTNGTVLAVTPTPPTAPSAQDPLFGITTVGSYFTDWNMDFEAARGAPTGTNQVNLNYVSASSYGEVNGTPAAATLMSAPAIDRDGNAYYTETLGANSYLVCIGNTPLHSNVHLKFRFLIPTATGLVDADGVNYDGLVGYQFVGSPVVDNAGNVYAAATLTDNTVTPPVVKNATVLCFRGNQSVAAVLPQGSTVDLTTTTISQPDEGGGEDNSIFRGPDTNIGAANAVYGQFVGSPSSLTFYNFGKRGSTFTQIAGSLTEPQPVTATDTLGSGLKTQLLMRTNLAWYTAPFQPKAKITGLSQVGSSLFLTDGMMLYSLPTNPAGVVKKFASVVPTGVPLGSVAATSLGTVAAPPSVGGSVMIVNGTAGIAALTRQVTVIADSGRVLGVDGDGGAVWAVDATTRTDLTTKVVTKVAFSHPAALSQFAVNDYLASDTGNNRCVRFDSGGNVRWELTRFSDQYGVLGPGQPLTLSQPSSVVVRLADDTSPKNPGGRYVYYLVADSGNNRVLEVTDRVDSFGNVFVDNGLAPKDPIVNHALTWASHTGDRDGRSYRYGSAAYYPNTLSPSGYSIAATVVNTRIAPLVSAGGLGAVSGDSAGGSIAVFNQPAAPTPFSTGAASDLAYTTAGFYAADASGKYVPFTIRNPRFLKLYTPPYIASPGTNPSPSLKLDAFDFLYADDNGAFDLKYDSGRQAFIATPERLRFTTADYQNMTLRVIGVGVPFARRNLPFVPVSVQELSADSQPSAIVGGSPATARRYLITQSHSQGELGDGGKIGGEVFEVDVTNPPPTTGPAYTNFGGYGVADIGGFGGQQTLSHPAFVGPLIQPADALRLP